jgi:hypothetical protein
MSSSGLCAFVCTPLVKRGVAWDRQRELRSRSAIDCERYGRTMGGLLSSRDADLKTRQRVHPVQSQILGPWTAAVHGAELPRPFHSLSHFAYPTSRNWCGSSCVWVRCEATRRTYKHPVSSLFLG